MGVRILRTIQDIVVSIRNGSEKAKFHATKKGRKKPYPAHERDVGIAQEGNKETRCQIKEMLQRQ